MKRIRFVFLLCIFFLSSCLLIGGNKGFFEHIIIEYSDNEIDEEKIDNYFKNNKDYPSYNELKTNCPNLLKNVKKLNDEVTYEINEIINDEIISKEKVYDRVNFADFYRFSSENNDFLNNETFMLSGDKYYHIGEANGGYGVYDIMANNGDRGRWIYFIYSYGTGAQKTELRVFNLWNNKVCFIKNLKLEDDKYYCLDYNQKTAALDLYEALVEPKYDDNGFITFEINKVELYKKAIDEMKKEEIDK